MAMNVDQYLSQLQALLPRGIAWTRDSDAVLTKLLKAFAEEFARVDARCDALLDEADPRTTYELLTDWERVLDLPDSCSSANQTVEQRQAALVTKLTAIGGQTPAYYIGLAAALGFTVTITEYSEWSVEDDVEAALSGPDWNFAWQINAPLNTVVEWTVESDVNTPFAVWGNSQLECVISKYKPAHTAVLFAYT